MLIGFHFGDLVDGVGDHVADQAQGVLGGTRRSRGEVLLDDVVLGGPGGWPATSSGERSGFCSSASTWYIASSHMAVALIVIEVFIPVERDVVEQLAHLAEVRDRYADLPTSPRDNGESGS